MSLNEVILFAALISIGVITGCSFGYFAAKRNKELAQGMILALITAIIAPLAILILWTFCDGSLGSFRAANSARAAMGIIFLYGIGTSMASVPPALISCWLMFRSRKNT